MLFNDSARKPQTSKHIKLQFDHLEDRCLPAGIVAVGADNHNPARVQVFDAQTHALKYDLQVYDRGFRGGINVAVGDINGDGTPDIVTAAGPGGLPQVRVYDGNTGTLMPGAVGEFLAFTASFRGGVNIATGDVNGDGYADIITGAGAGGSPYVKAFSGADGSVLANFLAYDAKFKGGVRVAAGDFRHRSAADIVVAPGVGGPPLVKVFAGDTRTLLSSYQAFKSNFKGGVYLGTGDINHDGSIDVIAGAGRLGHGLVRVFAGSTNTLVTEFYADKKSYPGEAHVDAVDGNGDGYEDILIGLDSSRGPVVKIFDGASGQLTQSYSALDRRFSGGISVAGSVPRGRGTSYELTAPVTKEIPVLERLARYVPIDATHTKGQYIPVDAASIDADQHVYVISHGWAPGYRDWVNKYIDTHVLKWWETAGYNNTQYPAPSPDPGPDSVWMFQGYSEAGVTISPPGGLAEQITKADPKAVVIAYSWIDDSATTSALSNSIPQQAYLSEALTNINGFRMAAAIQQALGTHFNGQLHLMGHSHGSKVATIAAVSLKQNGRDPEQLTIFDSPESAETDELNATNFLWEYFQQLTLGKTSTAGTTFVDNYFSAFGVNYAPMKIGSDYTLGQVVDTQLFAFPYSYVYQRDPGDWHAYAPAWYAQANALPSSGTNGGLAWSPILGNTPPTASQWEQSWSRFTYSTATQADVEQPSIPNTNPDITFAPVTISDSNSQPVTSIELSLAPGLKRTFLGSYAKKTGWSGIEFDYLFTGTGAAQLKIQVNDYLAYYIDSRYLKSGVTQHVTFNIGWPAVSQNLAVAIIPLAGVNSQATVTLSNFRQFDQSTL